MDLLIVLLVESRMVSIVLAHKVDVSYLDIFSAPISHRKYIRN